MARRPSGTNLAAPEHGAAVISVTDEFFAPARRMLSSAEPEFDAARYDANGKWMDGWESRRRRDGGYDACVVRLCPGVIRGVDIDTRNFTGNYAPAASLEACACPLDPEPDTRWTELVARTALAGDRHHFISVDDPRSWTHVRLKLFPDGGVARLRVFGEPRFPTPTPSAERWIDLAAGGHALACNDMHFGDMSHLIAAEPPAGMADGWETRRRREPGNDWVVLRLSSPGRVRRAVIDTRFFKGNHPARCSLRAVDAPGDDDLQASSPEWPLLLPPVALGPDQVQWFEHQLRDVGPVSHVRLDIFPDGGVARLRLLGEVEESR